MTNAQRDVARKLRVLKYAERISRGSPEDRPPS